MEYPKLPKEFKDKWVAALRSGKYKQGNNQLYNDATDGYCCLGVAAVIAGIPLAKIQGMPFIGKRFHYLKPESITQYSYPSELIYNGENDCIARHCGTLNDCGNLSFEEIANWIEENL